jgi:predicted nucleic acid-binding protein
MSIKVLDSWALISFFEDESAAAEVEKLLVDAGNGTHTLLLSVVNWGEIYYSTMRRASQEAAEQVAREIAGLSVEIVGVESQNMELARQAAVFKATRKMSYVDAFAAALAKVRGAALVTGDGEFRQVEDEIKIEWLPGPRKRG